jgi:hypothetical protein
MDICLPLVISVEGTWVLGVPSITSDNNPTGIVMKDQKFIEISALRSIEAPSEVHGIPEHLKRSEGGEITPIFKTSDFVQFCFVAFLIL